jgi:hypothetical protein
LVLGLLLAAPAFAHDTLPRAWCIDPNTTPIVVARFDIAPESLQRYREENPILQDPPPDQQCTDLRSCGIVDDWFWANQRAQEICAGSQPVAQRSLTSRTSPPMPFVHAPSAFNARNHHDAYRFGSGHLVGSCVICVPSTAVPAPGEPAPK